MGFINSVDRGRLGQNIGRSNGMQRINKWIYGIQRSRYYLFGGESGSGKTTAVDYMFLFSPYRQMLEEEKKGELEVKINWEYYSFEQSKRAKQESWSSKIMYNMHNLRLPISYILSKGKNRISDEHYQLCITVNDYIEELCGRINMVDVPFGPSTFIKKMSDYGSKNGKWILEPIFDSNGNIKGHKPVGWTPNDPNAMHIIMMDHIAYADLEKPTLKQNIDTISRATVFFREMCGWTFVYIQQFNTELASIERQKFKKGAIAPQRVDFGDSRYTFQDADVVFGLLRPGAYDLEEFLGYEVARFSDYFTCLFLMKNRHDGPADRVAPVFMDPIAGTFQDLPNPTDPLAALTSFENPIQPFYDKAADFERKIEFYHE